jgi:hypothetical protein
VQIRRIAGGEAKTWTDAQGKKHAVTPEIEKQVGAFMKEMQSFGAAERETLGMSFLGANGKVQSAWDPIKEDSDAQAKEKADEEARKKSDKAKAARDKKEREEKEIKDAGVSLNDFMLELNSVNREMENYQGKLENFKIDPIDFAVPELPKISQDFVEQMLKNVQTLDDVVPEALMKQLEKIDPVKLKEIMPELAAQTFDGMSPQEIAGIASMALKDRITEIINNIKLKVDNDKVQVEGIGDTASKVTNLNSVNKSDQIQALQGVLDEVGAAQKRMTQTKEIKTGKAERASSDGYQAYLETVKQHNADIKEAQKAEVEERKSFNSHLASLAASFITNGEAFIDAMAKWAGEATQKGVDSLMGNSIEDMKNAAKDNLIKAPTAENFSLGSNKLMSEKEFAKSDYEQTAKEVDKLIGTRQEAGIDVGAKPLTTSSENSSIGGNVAAGAAAGSAGGPWGAVIGALVTAVIEALKKVNSVIKIFGDIVGGFIQGVANAFGPLFKELEPLGKAIGNLLASFGHFWGAIIKAFAAYINLNGLMQIFIVLLDVVGGAFRFVGTAINGVVKFIGGFIGWWDELGKTMGKLAWVQGLISMFVSIGEAIGNFFTWVGGGFVWLWEALKKVPVLGEAAKAIENFFASIWNGLSQIFSGDFLTPLAMLGATLQDAGKLIVIAAANIAIAFWNVWGTIQIVASSIMAGMQDMMGGIMDIIGNALHAILLEDQAVAAWNQGNAFRRGANESRAAGQQASDQMTANVDISALGGWTEVDPGWWKGLMDDYNNSTDDNKKATKENTAALRDLTREIKNLPSGYKAEAAIYEATTAKSGPGTPDKGPPRNSTREGTRKSQWEMLQEAGIPLVTPTPYNGTLGSSAWRP